MDDKITLTVALANINSTLEVLKDNPLFPSIIQPNLSSVKLVLQDQLTALEPAPEGQTVVDLTGYHDLEPEIPPVEVKKNHTYRVQEETTEGWVNYEDQNKKVSQLTKQEAKDLVDELIGDGINPDRLKVVVDGIR